MGFDSRFGWSQQSSKGSCPMTCLNAVGVSDVLASPKWPADWPYSPRDFARGDESPDSRFYDTPRFCFHVDDAAVAALTDHYTTALRQWEKPAILTSQFRSEPPGGLPSASRYRSRLVRPFQKWGRMPNTDLAMRHLP